MQDLTKGRHGLITRSKTDNRVLYRAQPCLGPPAQKEVVWSPQARDLGYRPRPSDCGVWSLHCTLSLGKVLSSSELKILACFFLGGLGAEHVPVNLAVSGAACCLPQPYQLVPVIGSGAPAACQAQPRAETRAKLRHHSIPAAGCGHRRHFVQVTGKRTTVLEDSRGNFANCSRT